MKQTQSKNLTRTRAQESSHAIERIVPDDASLIQSRLLQANGGLRGDLASSVATITTRNIWLYSRR